VFRDLDAVEIQQTFYRSVPPQIARRWRETAPEEFVFCVKASQFITHRASSPTYRRSGRVVRPSEFASYGGFQDTPVVREAWEATRVVSDALRARAIVFQSPASFGPSAENVASLYRFFESIETPALRAWEPRGAWATHVIETICADLELVHVVDPFVREPATYSLAYFRLHGSPPGPVMYRYSYTAADLERIRTVCNEYDDALVLFNNVTMHGDARRFRALVAPAPNG
jgi:uncharacterized protein YecE (DUF72 family)